MIIMPDLCMCWWGGCFLRKSIFVQVETQAAKGSWEFLLWVSVSGTLHNWGTKLWTEDSRKTPEGGRDCYKAMFRFWVDVAEVQGARVRGQGTLSQQWPSHLGWRLHVSAEHSDLGAVTITCLAWMQTESKLCLLRVIVRFSAAVFPKVPYQTDLNVTKTTGSVIFSHPFQWKQVSDRFSSE